MKTYNHILQLKTDAKMLVAFCTFVFVVVFVSTGRAQTTASATGNIDKSALVIHGNARDAQPDRMTNNHRERRHMAIKARVEKHVRRASLKKGHRGHMAKKAHARKIHVVKKHIRLGKKSTSRHRVGFHHH